MASATALRHSHSGSHHAAEDPASPTLPPERRNSDGDLKPIALTSEHLRGGGERPTTPKPPINTPESLSPDSYSPLLRSATSHERSSHARHSSRGSAVHHTDDLNPVTRRQQFVGGFESADPLFLPPRMEAQQAKQASSSTPAKSATEKPVAGEQHTATQSAPAKAIVDPSKKDEHHTAPQSVPAKAAVDTKKNEHHTPEPTGAAKVVADVKPKVTEAAVAVSVLARKTATDVHPATQAAVAPVKASRDSKQKTGPERASSPAPSPVSKPPMKTQLADGSHTIAETAHKTATEASHVAHKVAEPVKDKLTVKPTSAAPHVESHVQSPDHVHHETPRPSTPSRTTSQAKPMPASEAAPASRAVSSSAPKVSQSAPHMEQKPASAIKTSPELKPMADVADTRSTLHMHPPRGHERSKGGSSGSIYHVDDLVPVTRSKSSAPPSPRPDTRNKPPHHLDLAVHDVKPEPIMTPKMMPEFKPLVHAPDVTNPAPARPKAHSQTSATSASSATAAAAITAALLGRAVSPKLDTTTAAHAADVYNPARPVTPKPDNKVTHAPSPSPAPPSRPTSAMRRPHSTSSQHAHFHEDSRRADSHLEQPNSHKTVQSTAVRRASSDSDDHKFGPKIYKTFLIGASRQPQQVSTHLLTTKSPYFAQLFAGKPSADNLPYPDIDDFAFKIWQRWLNTGKLGSLTGTGAEDFHALTHFLGVYCLAVRWEMEALQNQAMDVIRNHYTKLSLTSPPYRLEYIYSHTISSDLMRDFLVSTAAWRAINEPPLSDSMKALLAKGGDLAADFTEALIKHARDPFLDVRKLGDCEYHVHTTTPPCDRKKSVAQYDGPGDHCDHCDHHTHSNPQPAPQLDGPADAP